MIKNILLPFDGLRTSEHSMKYAIKLAIILNAKLYVLHVIDENSFLSVKKCIKGDNLKIKNYCLERTRGVLDLFFEEAKKNNFNNYQTNVVFHTSIANGIKAFVERSKADLCILEPSPYVGSEKVEDLAKRISKEIMCTSLFIKCSKLPSEKINLFVPVDEKEYNNKSANFAVEIAKQTSSKITLYHTTWIKPGIGLDKPQLHCDERVLNNFKIIEDILKQNRIEYEKIIRTDATIEGGIIQAAVRSMADIIVMTESRSIIGGRPELVMNNSMYPVIVLKK